MAIPLPKGRFKNKERDMTTLVTETEGPDSEFEDWNDL